MADRIDEKDAQLDSTLDALLRSYSAADPRPGYETRLRAVVSSRAASPWRASWLVGAASAAAVIAFAWIMIATTHTAKSVPDVVVAEKPVPPAPDAQARPVSLPPRKPGKPAADAGFAKVRKDNDSRIVLQLVEAAHGKDSVVFEREKLYLTPETLPEPEAVPVAQAQAQAEGRAPAVSIQAIGVAPVESSAPIEIKDIGSPKSGSEKGSL
jgi:hypothetical protein